MNIMQLLGALELGLLFGIVAMAVYLTFRVINFPDLTVDGSFPLGAAVAATLIVNGTSPFYATVAAMLIGGIAGFVTGYLHVRWKILGLLAGILTMTALSSINLRIMGRPNIALLSETTIFSGTTSTLTVLVGILVALMILLTFFLNSQFGLALRATGINARVCPAYGINVGVMTMIGLSISNGLVALSGALFAQVYGFADISMGTGSLIIGLASVIVGETLIRSQKIVIILLSCVLGSILYRVLIALALNTNFIGLQSSDLNAITAVMVVLALLIPQCRQRVLAYVRGVV